jgi:hypothetical protein
MGSPQEFGRRAEIAEFGLVYALRPFIMATSAFLWRVNCRTQQSTIADLKESVRTRALTTGWASSSGSPDESALAAPVKTQPRPTTLITAPIMRTLILSNSSGIIAATSLRHECYDSHAIQPRFVRLLTGRWAEPIRLGTRTNRATL